jgi:hypothetical protein
MEVVNEKQFDVQKEVEGSHGRNVGKLVWNLGLIFVNYKFTFQRFGKKYRKGGCKRKTLFYVFNKVLASSKREYVILECPSSGLHSILV